ncbi:GNAT family N-acetyltransferase [Ornithinimicrobium faecis]|uniref:GNAT family N-acetyltransferase n=1 Tax=Ornithinimicrobium faecis TaxID=2934158 RepID=A0ABY4YPP7_9MICO|nr:MULTISPECIES: GNAT family N-acetyltransferase [unclassified Ornithinimicrobium]USQ78748.1 GNAT family N-acetyltransferase [Ornithinimicrobium sp. HY1793]
MPSLGPGPHPVVVRAARPQEFAEIGRLLVAAYGPGGMPPDEPYWEALRDTAARERDAEVWVAEVDGRVGGTVTWAGHGSGQREIAQEGEAEFRMLGVDPELQGRGIGRALVEAVIGRARQDNYAALVMCSDAWMASAHRLYEGAGFVRLPDRDWSPVPGVDLIAYRLSL